MASLDPSAIDINSTYENVLRTLKGRLVDWYNNGIDFGSPIKQPLLHVQDQQAATTNGGTFTTGAWRTRVLNTAITNEITGASLASNQITLPAGTFYCDASAPAFEVDNHKAKLYNITTSADILIGTTENANNAVAVTNRSFVSGRFTLAAASVIELQHNCQSTKATTGFGLALGFSVVEVYSDIKIWWVGKT